MAVDTSIAMGYNPSTPLESPMNVMAKVYALKGAQQENALRDAQMAEYQRKIQDQNALRSTLAGFKPDMTAEEQVSALQRGGHLAEARLLAESSAKAAADKRAGEKAELEAEGKRLEMRGQVYGSVAANPTLETARSALQYLVGNKLVDPNNAAQVWQQIQANPRPENIRGLAQNFLNMSLTAKDQVDQRWKAVDAENVRRGQDITATTTRRGQDITAATAAARLAKDTDVDLQRRLAEARKAGEAAAGKAPGVTSPDAARAFLASAGFDPKTGEDDVSKLIPQSTGGLLGTAGAKVAEAFDVTTSGQAALGKLASRSSKLVLDLLGGKLGAGVSNADREFMLQAVGDIGNSMLSTGKRLAAWKDLRGRMETLANDSSGAAPAAGGGPKIGEVQDGYKFKGGNPADSKNWEKQ